MDFDIIVVANHCRKALVLDYLKDILYKISFTPDYELPVNFKPELGDWGINHTGAFRCFRGHQDAIKLCDKENVLILEDDAVPNTLDWYSIVQDSIPLLNNFEIVFLHGRNFDRSAFVNYKEIRPGNNFLTMSKKEGTVFIYGTLAYLLNRRTFDKVLNHVYDGLPMDLFLYSNFNFCLLEKSPFNHGNNLQGSLIEKA